MELITLGNRLPILMLGQARSIFTNLMPGRKASINYNELTLDGRVYAEKAASTDKTYKSYVRKIGQFPVESYRQLLWAVHQLDKSEFAIDPGSNNLLVDDDSFSLVDYKDKASALRVGMFPEREENNLAYVMSMLIDMTYREKIRRSEFHPNLAPPFGEIASCQEIIK